MPLATPLLFLLDFIAGLLIHCADRNIEPSSSEGCRGLLRTIRAPGGRSAEAIRPDRLLSMRRKSNFPRHASHVLPNCGFLGSAAVGFQHKALKTLARPERFERPTPRFVVWCSIQLSYGRVFRVTLGLNGPLHQKSNRKVAKERFSYPLRPELARSGTEASTGSGSGSRIQVGVADLENNRGELG